MLTFRFLREHGAMRLAGPLVALLLSMAVLAFALHHRAPAGDAPLAEPDAAMLVRARQVWPEATLAQLAHGRDLLRSACRECHGVPDPRQRPVQAWPRLVAHMGERAELAPDQREAVLRYVLSVR